MSLVRVGSARVGPTWQPAPPSTTTVCTFGRLKSRETSHPKRGAVADWWCEGYMVPWTPKNVYVFCEVCSLLQESARV